MNGQIISVLNVNFSLTSLGQYHSKFILNFRFGYKIVFLSISILSIQATFSGSSMMGYYINM